jgi:hypothetical protein
MKKYILIFLFLGCFVVDAKTPHNASYTFAKVSDLMTCTYTNGNNFTQGQIETLSKIVSLYDKGELKIPIYTETKLVDGFYDIDKESLKKMIEIYKNDVSNAKYYTIPVKTEQEEIGRICLMYFNGMKNYQMHYINTKVPEQSEVKFVLFDNEFVKAFFLFYLLSKIYSWIKQKIAIGRLASKYEKFDPTYNSFSTYENLKMTFHNAITKLLVKFVSKLV